MNNGGNISKAMVGKIAFSTVSFDTNTQASAGGIWLINKDGSRKIINGAGTALSFSPDGQKIAFADDKRAVNIIDLNGNSLAKLNDLIKNNWQWNRSSTKLLITHSTFRLLGTNASMENVHPHTGKAILGATQSRDGRITYFSIFGAGNSPLAVIYKITTDKLKANITLNDCEKISEVLLSDYFSGCWMDITASGKIIFSYSKGIEMIDPITKAVTSHSIPIIQTLRVSPDGNQIAIKNDGFNRVYIYSASTMKLLGEHYPYLPGQVFSLDSFDWSPQGDQLCLSITSTTEKTNCVYTYNLADKKMEKIFSLPSSRTRSQFGNGAPKNTISWIK